MDNLKITRLPDTRIFPSPPELLSVGEEDPQQAKIHLQSSKGALKHYGHV